MRKAAEFVFDFDILDSVVEVELWTARDFGPTAKPYVDDMCLSLHGSGVDCPAWLFGTITRSLKVQDFLETLGEPAP